MRLSHSDLSPDGVRLTVDWDKFVVGTSIFIPCVNIRQALLDIVAASGIPRSDLTKRVCVERGKYGLRVWKVR